MGKLSELVMIVQKSKVLRGIFLVTMSQIFKKWLMVVLNLVQISLSIHINTTMMSLEFL